MAASQRIFKSYRSTKPVHEIRKGRVIGHIWVNESRARGRYFTVTFSRLYKTEKWNKAQSFGLDDLPVLGQVIIQAKEWIFEQFGAGSDRTKKAGERRTDSSSDE